LIVGILSLFLFYRESILMYNLIDSLLRGLSFKAAHASRYVPMTP